MTSYFRNHKKDIIVYIITTVISFVIFLLLYGPRVLNPVYTDWLMAGGDLSQHYLGWKAFRASSWHFPVGLVDTLAYPDLTSIIFTDSIPIFAVIFKILSPILPSNFQYFGFWGLLSFILMGILSVRIMKPYITNVPMLIISGVSFTMVPVMIWRMFAHTALAGQWILLLSLDLVFNQDRYLSNTKKLYIIVGFIGALSVAVHMYFFVMNAIILFGAWLLDIFRTKRSLRFLIAIGIYAGIGIMITAILGGFSSGMIAQNGGLGSFSFNLNALINPQGWSLILKDLPLYGSGEYEGFAYLGIGVILLSLIALIAFFSNKNFKENFKSNWQLVSALVIIVLLSIIAAASPVVTAGSKVLFTMHVSGFITNVWSIVRASGRLVWPVVYIIMLSSFILIDRYLVWQEGVILVICAFILQTYDISGILSQRHQQFSHRQEYVSKLQNKDFWNMLASNTLVRHVVYNSTVSLPYMYSITDWALSNRKTVGNFYFAREHDTSINKRKALEELNPDTIFIFNTSEALECLRYNLDYYPIDGLIVGHKGKLSGFNPLSRTDLILTTSFGDNKYITNRGGEDTGAGRILYPRGASFGPYWPVPAGNYILTITGKDLSSGIALDLYSGHGKVHYSYQITELTENTIRVSFRISNDVSDFEVYIRNDNDNKITVRDLTLIPEKK